MATKPNILKFMPFSSSVDVGFWFELAKLKLDVLRLDSRALPATGFFGQATSADPPARFNLEASSFEKTFKYAISSIEKLFLSSINDELTDFC